MGYDYTVIQVVFWVELPKQRRLYPIFCENMDPYKWDTTVWYRVTRNPHEFGGQVVNGTLGFWGVTIIVDKYDLDQWVIVVDNTALINGL